MIHSSLQYSGCSSKNARALKVEPKGHALPGGQVPTHFRAPRPFSGQAGPRASAPFPGSLKLLLPPTLGLEIPPLEMMQLPRAL